MTAISPSDTPNTPIESVTTRILALTYSYRESNMRAHSKRGIAAVTVAVAITRLDPVT